MEGSTQLIALVLTLVVHIVGALFLVWALLGEEGMRGLRDSWPRDDRPDDDGPAGPQPRPSGNGLPVPLPDATQSPVRLREDGRLADARPRRPRRPDHAPHPARRPRVPA